MVASAGENEQLEVVGGFVPRSVPSPDVSWPPSPPRPPSLPVVALKESPLHEGNATRAQTDARRWKARNDEATLVIGREKNWSAACFSQAARRRSQSPRQSASRPADQFFSRPMTNVASSFR